jgi:hypothetical protein
VAAASTNEIIDCLATWQELLHSSSTPTPLHQHQNVLREMPKDRDRLSTPGLKFLSEQKKSIFDSLI